MGFQMLRSDQSQEGKNCADNSDQQLFLKSPSFQLHQLLRVSSRRQVDEWVKSCSNGDPSSFHSQVSLGKIAGCQCFFVTGGDWPFAHCSNYGCWKTKIHPRKQTWNTKIIKLMVCSCFSYSKGVFLGSMLIFRSVNSPTYRNPSFETYLSEPSEASRPAAAICKSSSVQGQNAKPWDLDGYTLVN